MTTEQMNQTIDTLQDERDSLSEFSPTFDDDFQSITDEIRQLEQESSVNASADDFSHACGYHEGDEL